MYNNNNNIFHLNTKQNVRPRDRACNYTDLLVFYDVPGSLSFPSLDFTPVRMPTEPRDYHTK